MTAIFLAYEGIIKIIQFSKMNEVKVPNFIALVVSLICILIKMYMFYYTKKAAKETNSGALMADAYHHRIDVISSVASLISILGARNGFPILDPFVAIFISILIFKTGISIFKDAVNQLVDHSCENNIIENIREIIYKRSDVESIDIINTRLFGNKIYVDIEIGINKDITIEKAYEISENIKFEIRKEFSQIKYCKIYINPY